MTASLSPVPLHPRSSLLHPELLAYLELGLSIHIGAVDAQARPQLTRALAVRALPGLALALLVPSASGAPLLQAVRDSGQVAVVLCQPTTHHAVQIKGREAVVEMAEMADWPQHDHNHIRFAAEIEPFGFERRYADAWFLVPQNQPDALQIVRFVPTGAWNQTPGPGAGAPMEWLA